MAPMMTIARVVMACVFMPGRGQLGIFRGGCACKQVHWPCCGDGSWALREAGVYIEGDAVLEP